MLVSDQMPEVLTDATANSFSGMLSAFAPCVSSSSPCDQGGKLSLSEGQGLCVTGNQSLSGPELFST